VWQCVHCRMSWMNCRKPVRGSRIETRVVPVMTSRRYKVCVSVVRGSKKNMRIIKECVFFHSSSFPPSKFPQADPEVVEQLRMDMQGLLNELSDLSRRNDELMHARDSDLIMIRDLDTQLREYKRKYELAKTELRNVKGRQRPIFHHCC
jgi:hypothetical protein